MKTIALQNGYDKSKNPETRTFRYMTIKEAKHLRSGQTCLFKANDGTFRRIKINGEPKTWKRSPGVEIPVKYGLYEYGRLGSKFLSDKDEIVLLIPVCEICYRDLHNGTPCNCQA